ncbi:MAG: hypothetical protein DRJ42_08430, partial [Deltaproteobacteria bacterium]
RALGALGGNRTVRSAVMVDGHLTRLSVRTSPRHASRRALQLIRSASPTRVLAALDEVCARYPDSSLPVCHRGELRLWLGDLPGARADLEAAIGIQPATRWAWIGLTGIETLEGHPEEALATSARGIALMNDTVGNSVYGYRADAEFALQRSDEALRDLEEAVRLSKSRLGAWVSLVAVLDHRGDHGRAAQIFARLLEDAPGLLSDAARELGVVLWSAPEARVSPSARRAVTDRALSLLGGNRSSTCITYRTSEGRLRLVPRPGGRRPHDTDDDDLAQVRALLLKVTGIAGAGGAQPIPEPRRPASTEPVPPSVIEQFVSRGYVAIRGALRRDLATRWVADAARRLREDPARWVRGYDPDDPVRSLDAFDVDDPTTWTWERLDLLGSLIMPLAEAAPEAWHVACALLGGGGRIDRGELSDHLVVNFHTRSHPDYTAPELGYPSWHLDDPSSEERLGSFQRGLIVFVILSDLPTASGAPFIAPESVALVARELARHPDGVDLRSRESTARLTAACTESVELTGEVGDVFLVHPFMLHSSSGNPSGRIRWMANPILTLREPLCLDGVDPSPLERSILKSI